MRIFIALLTCLILVACGKEPYNTYILRNKTSHVLNIKGFSSRYHLDGTTNILEAEEINIMPNSEVKFNRSSGEDSDQRTFFSVPDIDSIRIVFDSEKLLIQTCADLRNNESCPPIFNSGFEFAITEEDYENAVPIE